MASAFFVCHPSFIIEVKTDAASEKAALNKEETNRFSVL
jgi:hypothetical protein